VHFSLFVLLIIENDDLQRVSLIRIADGGRTSTFRLQDYSFNIPTFESPKNRLKNTFKNNANPNFGGKEVY